MTVEDRLQRLETRAEIHELLVRYALLIDDHEFDALGELFAPDAEFGSPGRTHRGRDAIVANYRDRGELYPVSLHEVHGVVLEHVDEAHVHGQVQAFSEQASAEHTVITSFRYDDDYVLLAGRWRFARRITRSLYAMTHSELAAGGLSGPLRKRWPHRAPEAAELPPFLFTGAR